MMRAMTAPVTRPTISLTHPFRVEPAVASRGFFLGFEVPMPDPMLNRPSCQVVSHGRADNMPVPAAQGRNTAPGFPQVGK